MIIINKAWKGDVVNYEIQMAPNCWAPKFIKPTDPVRMVLVKFMIKETENYLYL